PVVFGDAIGAAERAGLDLAGAGGDGDVGDGGALRFARAMGHDRRCSRPSWRYGWLPGFRSGCRSG
ncbi:hypothetical protein, partial [Plasmodium yoelii yoelii]